MLRQGGSPAYIAALVERGIPGLLLSDETTVASDPHRIIGMLADLVGRYGRLAGALFTGSGPRAAG